MCTLALAFQIRESPLVLFSSRDENLQRPSSPPFTWENRKPALFGPRDDKEGGTWLGVNEHRVLVAITNRFGAPRIADRNSRGHLVVDALTHDSAERSFDVLRETNPFHYNGFHLLIADRDNAFVVWSDGETLGIDQFEPGWIVVTEQSYGAAGDERASWLHDALNREQDPRTLFSVRSEHDPFSRPNILVEELEYGTRSNSFVTVGDSIEFEYVVGDDHKFDQVF